ncbi:hypothetical protein KIPB_009540 [Kipferlia bialata]|uniref:Tyr recombinase domain-containing protein n=1 Tax=Kipferlia bialata TaxID=797122 RepID=A0A9K3GLL9_9EUKA|nr:hypothetical protein KIPB_009540 [Kipferlia bialata]|eukprot:g9540.t1
MSALLDPASDVRALSEGVQHRSLREALRLLRHLSLRDDAPPADINVSWPQIKEYLHLRASGAPNYIRTLSKDVANITAVISSDPAIPDACVVEGKILAKQSARSGAPTKRAPTVSPDSIARAVTDISSPFELRLVLMAVLSYVRMARLGEMCDLHLSDVQVSIDSISVYTRACKNRQASVMPWSTGSHLEGWKETDPESFFFGKWPKGEPFPDFDSHPDKAVDIKALSSLFDADITGHSFRRSSAAAATINGASTRAVMAWGGWKSESGMLPYMADASRLAGGLASSLMLF